MQRFGRFAAKSSARSNRLFRQIDPSTLLPGSRHTFRDQIFDLQRRYGSLAAYANKITRTERSESGEDVERKIPFLKGHTVFNVEQIDGLPDHYYAQPAPRFDPITRIEHAEFFFRATGADIRYGGGRAFYSPSQDFIRMPPFEAFRDAESHYSTLAHETVHWTRHPPSRLGRKRCDEGYAIEELSRNRCCLPVRKP